MNEQEIERLARRELLLKLAAAGALGAGGILGLVRDALSAGSLPATPGFRRLKGPVGVDNTRASIGLNVHNGMNNFYNEPPFAERLLELSQQGAVPETIQDRFVETVVCCYIGNGYGVSWAAAPSYEQIIRSFSPREIAVMIRLAISESVLGRRVGLASCRKRFKETLLLIAPASVPSGSKAEYEKFIK